MLKNLFIDDCLFMLVNLITNVYFSNTYSTLTYCKVLLFFATKQICENKRIFVSVQFNS